MHKCDNVFCVIPGGLRCFCLLAGALDEWCEESCKESKEAKAARYDTKDVITFMHAAFLSALCDIAFSGREYDMQRAMTEAYTIDDEVPPDDAPYPSDD